MIKKITKKLLYEGSILPVNHVMMFHHIDDGNIVKKSNCVLKYSSFIEFIDSGLEFISIAEYINFKYENRNKCVITFDDGLEDVYRVAYPELKKRNIPFAIFIVTDFLDKEGYIGREELIEMSTDPLVTICSHGVTHQLLSGMDEYQQVVELEESKKILEQIIQKPVNYFAYSHGKYDNETLKLLRENDWYDFAFGVQSLPTNSITKSWKWHLPRINFDNNGMRYQIIRNKGKVRLSYK